MDSDTYYHGEDEEFEEYERLLANEDVQVHEMVREWAQGSSMHGVAVISDDLNMKLWFRMLWLVLLLISTTIMVVQLTQLIKEYKNYEVLTDTQTIVPSSLAFPEITVCNANIFSKALKAEVDFEEPKTLEEFRNVTSPVEDFITNTWFNDKRKNVTRVWRESITDFGRCWAFTTNEQVVQPGLHGGLEVWMNLNQDDYESASDLAGVLVFIAQPGTPVDDQIPFVSVNPGKEGFIKLTKRSYKREREAPWARCLGAAPAYSQPRCRAECLYNATRAKCSCKNYGDYIGPAGMPFCSSDDDECLFGNSSFVEQALNVTAEYEKCSCSLPPCEETLYSATTSDLDHSEAFLNAWAADDDTLLFDDDFFNFDDDFFNDDGLSSNDDGDLFGSSGDDFLGSSGDDSLGSSGDDSLGSSGDDSLGSSGDDSLGSTQRASVNAISDITEELRNDFLQNFVGIRINFDQILSEELTESKAVTFSQLLGSIGGSMGLFVGISALSIFEICGDLLFLRLIPRMWGQNGLFGVGTNRAVLPTRA
eukprot:CAMPEP_0172452064 /NCGR_PEP_ID=MMETSP1065-20121228/9825_1 /TAXON_ID=265537 /ORGANISM="Amphiprora paludosa, Strain CCMP125" /LENGTH=534 /DNA_ID=CAMNT_0013204057 /DNA_START=60 /DNA_END=1664 /DNA_ORIENTATION=-